MSEFVRIDGSVLLIKDFLPVAKNLLNQMISRNGSKYMLSKEIYIQRHTEAFQKDYIMASDIINKVAAT